MKTIQALFLTIFLATGAMAMERLDNDWFDDMDNVPPSFSPFEKAETARKSHLFARKLETAREAEERQQVFNVIQKQQSLSELEAKIDGQKKIIIGLKESNKFPGLLDRHKDILLEYQKKREELKEGIDRALGLQPKPDRRRLFIYRSSTNE